MADFTVDRKVTVGAVSTATIGFLCWIADFFYQVKIPAEQALGLTVIVNGIIQWAVPNKVKTDE